MMFGGFGGFGWIGMILQLLVTIGLIVGFVILVVWAVRRMSVTNAQSGPQKVSGAAAKEIAQARYAKGEITREEFQQIMTDLGN